MESGDKVPDEKTVWAFREKLTNERLVEEIFSQFSKHIESKGFIINEGKIVDASYTVAPRQRNTRDENKKIKEGNGDELMNDKPNKKKHKDNMLAGQKRMEKHFSDIKTMQRLILKVNLLTIMRLRMHTCMILNN